MSHTPSSRIIVITLILIVLTAIAVNANWGSRFSFSLFAAAEAGNEPNEIAADHVPDGLSASDWDGIRAAYEASRSSSIGSIGQEAYLKPAAVGTTQASDSFGQSVAVAGDTVVVGAHAEDSSTTGVNSTPNESSADSGAAYVFTRSAGVWTQQAYLKPAAVGATQAGDNFGISVAVAGDTVVVGAHFEDSSTTGVNSTPDEGSANSGAAYVFTRSAGVWTQQAYLKPGAVGTTQAFDSFGWSVAVAGDTVVVGAYQEDSSTTGVNSTPNDDGTANSSGAAYVFTRSAGVWTQQAYLKPAAVGTTQAGDNFGFSVAVSGDTVVVGANTEDSSTSGVNSTPDESSNASGAAYVFTRSAGVWTQQAYLKPAAVGTTQVNDEFGFKVAVAGDTVVVGANQEDSSTTGVNSTPDESAANAGAAYVFTRSAGVWTQQAYLKPAAVGTTQVNDNFGYSVAVSGDTVVVGAFLEDSGTTGVNNTPDESSAQSGAAYVFTRSAGVWAQQAYLKPAAIGTTQAGDVFGRSVAVAGDTVVVGATGEDSGTTGVNSTPNESAAQSGAAYVFTGLGPPTPTPTDTPTNTATNTPTATATDTPTNTPTDTPTNTPTNTSTATPTALPTCAPTPTGMTAWWRGENNPNDTVANSNGELVGGTTYTAGMVGQAFSFDGVDDLVNIPNNAPISFGPASPFSIDLWVKLSANGSVGTNIPLITKHGAGFSQFGFDLLVHPDTGKFAFILDNYGVSQNRVDGATTPLANTWYHVTGTTDGSTIKLYVNGSLEGSTPRTVNGNAASTPFEIGHSAVVFGGPNPSPVARLQDEVEVFNRALTLTEIQDIYNAGPTGNCVPVLPTPTVTATSTPTLTASPTPTCLPAPNNLVSWWAGDGNFNDTVSGNNGANAGSTTFVSGRVGQAFHFDGSGSSFITIPDSPSLNPASNRLTIDAWIRPDFSFPNSLDTILKKRGINCGSPIPYSLSVAKPSGSIFFTVADGTLMSSVPIPNDAQFHHVAGTYDGAVIKLYVDGVNAGQMLWTGIIPAISDPVFIGKHATCGQIAAADMDEIQFFDRALNASEVTDIYNAGSNGTCPASTATPTNTNTPTFTPTATPTDTPTATATITFTPTPTATETFTPTPAETPSIHGTVLYGNAAAPPKFISNVLITGTGSPIVTMTTDPPGPTAGQYMLTGFGTGPYTVTPSKTGGVNGINSFDAARIAQHVAGTSLLSGNALIVADVSGNTSVTSFDAAQIARYVTSTPPYGITGTWKFLPVNRTYSSVNANITGEDYFGLLMGEVSGNWNNTGARPVGRRQLAEGSGPERGIEVKLSQMAVSTEKEIIIPVSVQGVANKVVISYEFGLRYDPSVIQPVGEVVDLKGTVSRGLSVVANPYEPGLLRVVVYGAMPIDENGVLLNLRFTAVGKAGSSSPLTFESIMFNEGDPRVMTSEGQVVISN